MKPRINLCIFNHPRRFILDQIWFAREAFEQNGYEMLSTNTLRPDCLNILIENFVESDADAIAAFCRRFDKQIGVVLTEHMELEDGTFSFAGAPLNDLQYIGNRTQRLFSVLSLVEHVFGFFTFGELPELRTWSDIVPTHGVHRFPYPLIGGPVNRPARRDHDLVFTGTLTEYRLSVLKELKDRYRVIRSPIGETELERLEHYNCSKVAINIPQNEDWKWISPMRVMFGLRCGVPTVHVGGLDSTMFSRLVMKQVDLDSALSNCDKAFRAQLSAFEDFVKSEYNSRFPSEILDIWGELELPG